MRRVVLMGNPNVGKSVLFSRLTGADVIVSNYPGTTVDVTKGTMWVEGERVEIIDAPGTYSLEPANRAEEVAFKILKEADIVVNVVDATNLERNLYLTLELRERGAPIVIALNLWDEAQHLGIHIDSHKLERRLGIPVIPTVALTGEGIKNLVSLLSKAKSPRKLKPLTQQGRWVKIGSIISEIQRVEHRHHTLQDWFADATIKPLTGIPIALGVLLFLFWVVRFIGESLSKQILDPLFERLYKPLIVRVGMWLGPGLVHDLLIGRLINGDIDFEQSLGILSTGLFVPLGLVLPYIVAFYFMLSLLEDSGYLPRLATLADNVFHRIGIHGQGIVPLFLGLGCNVSGVLSTRILETRKQRFISAVLVSITIPCTAQVAMIFAIFSELDLPLEYPPAMYVALVFLILGILHVSLGLLLNRFMRGESPEIFLEIPHYRRPHLETTVKKTWMRVKWFLRDGVPWLFFGILVINILETIGLISWLSILLTPAMKVLFGLPGETSIVLLTGFLRKDLAVGLLLGLPTSFQPLQLVILSTMLTVFFPCAATFAVLTRELGIQDMARATAVMIAATLAVGIILRFILLGM